MLAHNRLPIIDPALKMESIGVALRIAIGMDPKRLCQVIRKVGRIVTDLTGYAIDQSRSTSESAFRHLIALRSRKRLVKRFL
jgi:hypothetical protein